MFKAVPEVPKTLLTFLNSCFFIVFWVNVYFFPLLQIVDLSPISFPSLLVPCILFFISLCIAFTFSYILQPYSATSMSILITSVLNCASDRLAISSLLSCISSGALICSFVRGICFLPGHSCYVLRSRALGIHQGKPTLFAVLWWCMWGRGQRGNNAQLSAGFQSLPLLPTSKLGPSGADSQVGGPM